MTLIPGDHSGKANARLDASLLQCTLRSRALPSSELSQQLLRFLLRQSSPNHLLRHSPPAIKLVAFGKVAFVKVGKGSTHPGMIEGCARFADDGDLIVVAATEPVEGQHPSPSAISRQDQRNALSTGGMHRPGRETTILP